MGQWLRAWLPNFSVLSLPSGSKAFVDAHPHLGAYVKQLSLFPGSFDLHVLVFKVSLRALLSAAVLGLPSLRCLSLHDIRLASDNDSPSVLPLVEPETETK